MESSVVKPSQTQIVRLGSVIEDNRTHSKIWSIAQNRMVDNRTKSNFRLSNGRQTPDCLIFVFKYL